MRPSARENGTVPFARFHCLFKNIVLVATVVVALGVAILVISALYSRASGLSFLTQGEGKHAMQEVKRLHVKGAINAVAWNRDGSRLAALSDYGSTITLWETKNWTVVKEFDRDGGSYSRNSFAFLPDGSVVTAAPMGGYSKHATYANIPAPFNKYKTLEIFSLIQWNLETSKPVRYIPDLGYPPKDMSNKITDTFAVSKDGSLIAGIHGYVLLYETRSGSLVKKLPIPPSPAHPDLWSESYKKSVANNPPTSFRDWAESVAFSPDGTELAVGTGSGMVHYFSLEDGRLLRSFEAYIFHFDCKAIAYSPDGRFIATGKAYRFNLTKPDNITTDVWRVSDNKKIASLEGSVFTVAGIGMPMHVRSLSWSPSGDVLVVADENSLRVWQISEFNQKVLFMQEVKGIHSTAYSPQGNLAVTSNNDVIIFH